jgi:transcriptional regulator with XRE-family HTH domain
VYTASISSYINNKQRPGMKTLKNLAIALGVTVDELRRGEK